MRDSSKKIRRRRLLAPAAAVLVFWSAGAAAAAEAYIESVPVPVASPQPQASVLYYRDGTTVLARLGATDHSDVPLTAVSPDLRHAVLAAEDRDFYGHAGVSARGVLRAAVADVRGGRQGASTITQQYARTAFLSQEVSVDRKARELALAVNLERQLGKDQILERYLNSIYFGRGAYGIAAAAYAYFRTTPDRLDFAQSAVLASVIKDPWGFDPDHDATAARQRWDWIVAAADAQGWVSAAAVRYPTVPTAEPAVAGPAGLIADQVEQELARSGITSAQLHTEGLTVVTTLDAAAEQAAVASVANALAGQPKGLEAALVAVDPETGGVRAYYGGALGSGYFDYAGTLHPAASTFKPIVLAAALARNISYLSRWDGSSPRLFPSRGVPLRNHDGLQCPDCTLKKAMVDSLNTPFYAVTDQIGAGYVRDTAIRMGIPATYDGHASMVDLPGEATPGKTRADIAIGRYPVTTGDLATVYATLAAGGVRHTRHFVQSVNALPDYDEPVDGERTLDAAVAADVSTVLQAVVTGHGISPGRPAAAKTGTQQYLETRQNQDAWTAGYTPDLATAVWMGRATPAPIKDKHGTAISGETLPSEIWQQFTHRALLGSPTGALPAAAHLGRTDVGDAGRSTSTTAESPDSVDTIHAAASGYEPVVQTEHTGKRLALTFDDGPSEYTPAVLDLLAKYQIKATFCVVGENVGWYPATVRRIVAEGHRLCNHSMRHDDLGILSAAASKQDIAATDAAISVAAPGAEVPYYRAPYGDFGPSAKSGAELGHTPLGWVVDPDDWTTPGASVIASRIEKQLTPRAVVLVHDGGGDRQQTVDALTTLIPSLLADGWTFDQPQRTIAPTVAPATTVTTAPAPSSPAPSSPAPSSPSPSSPSAAAPGSPSATEPEGPPSPSE
ncbi:transglycosylase domain-containing protein [Actinoplanes sp. NPDC051851]|uniref:transglycosylase domain-containing protein n=1 Tax=Actinoplanes sp. NPDC051851 TaxID=3154753 RepID=UPI00342DA48A